MIEITNVTKQYGPKVAVSDLNLSVPDGELFAFLGPNGAGKTTTIKMLCGLLAVVFSWAAVTAHVVYHDVWPRYFADAPPALQIDLADEATQQAPTKWTIYRGGKKIGTLTTRMEYLAADDTFRFVNNYGRLTLDAGKSDTVLSVEAPRLVTTIRVTRTGELREQSMSGELRVLLGPIEIGHAAAEVEGRVVNGVLLGRCKVRYPIGAAQPTNGCRIRHGSPGRPSSRYRSQPIS